MNNTSGEQTGSDRLGERSVAGLVLRSTILGTINLLSTNLAIQAYIHDLPIQGPVLAITGLSNIASLLNAAPEFVRLSRPRNGDTLSINLARTLLSLTPFFATYIGAWSAVPESPYVPVYPPPTPPITPEWMIPKLDYQVQIMPRLTGLIHGLQELSSRMILSM